MCVIAGCGGEIAEAVAVRLAAEDGVVVGIDRAEPVTGFPVFAADLTSEDQVREVFAAITAEYGRIDVLHNNAGPLHREDRSLFAGSAQIWDRVFRDNLTPVVLACKYGIPAMLAGEGSGGGSVINTGSFLAGMGAATAQMAFSAAKAAVTQLSRDLGVHLARQGVRVNALALGPVETAESRAMFETLGPDGAARRFTHIPTGRFATVREIAGTVAYLASDDSGYVTASVVPVNGGIPHAYTLPE
ncbi:SDR family oxidoreductase [Streptomyces sp. BI20]|uniref:SDR family oxidoreductase n=1 Tax=Streptomyces sp. BI20 TaxID=3403460 RepID=UPI003C726455